MILQPLTRKDFDFQGDIVLDRENAGFKESEIKLLAEAEAEAKGAKGIDLSFWRINRQPPPELKDLKSEFGYQANPFLTDLRAVAEAQGTKLEGTIAARPNS